MKRNNILIIIEGLYPPLINSSGVKIIYKYLIEIAKDHNLHVLTTISKKTDPNWKKWAEEQKKYNLFFHFVDTRRYDINPVVRLGVSKYYLYKYAKQIIKNYQIDLVHEFSSIPALSLITAKYKVPKIFTLCTVNNSWLGKINYEYGFRKLNYLTFAGKKQYINANKFFKQKEHKRLRFTPFGCEKISTKNTKTMLMKELRIPKNKKIFSFIGPMEKRKGIDVLLKAVKMIKDRNFFLIIATFGKGGVDDNFNKHYKLVKKELKNVNHKIIVGTKNIADIFKITDVFILPSTSLEGTLAQPLTLLEAIYSKKNIIASDLDENKIILNDYKGWLIFKNNNPYSLMNMIEQSLNGKIQSFKGDTSKLLVEKQAKNMIRLYKKIL